jgi:hypothetical protein
MGARLLVKTTAARTDLDRVEEEGHIIIPKWVKRDNAPLPTTGIVLLVGPDVPCSTCSQPERLHRDGYLDCGTFTPIIGEGDMIMYPKFAGSDLRIEEEDLRILEAVEVLCTLVDTQQVLQEVKADGE